jgi:Tol biopolymer transport system component
VSLVVLMKHFFKSVMALHSLCAGLVILILAWSSRFPLSDVVAYTSVLPNNAVYLLDVGHQMTRSLAHTPMLKHGLRWSPDGDRLAYINGTNIISIMDFKGNPEQQLRRTRMYMRSVAWSIDGRELYFTAAENGPIRLHMLTAAGADTLVVETLPVDYHDLTWSPDGQKLTFSSLHEGDHEIYVMDWSTSTLQRLTERSSIDVSPSWSPDGSAIVYMSQKSGHYEINIFDFTTGQTQPIIPIANPVRTPLWSHDGQRLLYASGPRIYAVNLDGSQQRELINVGVQIGTMALQPLLG